MKEYGIADLSVLALRKEPSHASEQVSQLLFGELYEVVNQQKSWLLVKCCHDGYEAWLNEIQFTAVNAKDFQQLINNKPGLALELASVATSSGNSIPLVAGSSLPFFDGLNFKLLKEKYIYNGQALLAEARNPSLLEKVAFRYLNAPYLWGGRSPFGIDCSGYTQLVYKFLGYNLLRDAYQQCEQGGAVGFVEESQPGDLAFFSNTEGKIVHTGIILKDKRIIHASGKVKIDHLDHFGIFSPATKKYSHQLKTIRRIF
jgi:gamma-D-glutamyl-L-lysine dipeptidyl-peptidase